MSLKPRLKPLDSQTIVVTGATSGIGLTIVRRAAAAGAKVVLVARDENHLEALTGDLVERGYRADYVPADVGVRADMRRVAQTVVRRHGGFDTWVNNAGVGAFARLAELSDEDHHRIFQTNYWGVVYGSLEALRHMRGRGGALINIGSILSDMPAPVIGAYAASKHAVKGFTNSLRLELMHEGTPVAVTLIKPSSILTPFPAHAKNYMDEAAQVPPPLYHPELVADAVLYAAEHGPREMVIGGAGLLQTSFARLAPALADQVYSRLGFLLTRDPSRPKRLDSALFAPGFGGRQLGDQSGPLRKTSALTAVQTHPAQAIGLAIAAAAVLIGSTRVAAGPRSGRR